MRFSSDSLLKWCTAGNCLKDKQCRMDKTDNDEGSSGTFLRFAPDRTSFLRCLHEREPCRSCSSPIREWDNSNIFSFGSTMGTAKRSLDLNVGSIRVEERLSSLGSLSPRHISSNFTKYLRSGKASILSELACRQVKLEISSGSSRISLH
ncbi:hypothetical protein EUGRSUZ_C04270 [Eucalyptus grandis]|uniref:Uncharacterized protein n=2 Tax=Eucalyptus grandis TaxID=71139 RepID=A0ACC3LM86_EUCGR|nr:hypothetical protein EUGRSUZ_C04270 [Eucalyptus grandis]